MRLADDPLVPVRLDLRIGDQRLQDAFCWDSTEPDSAISTFSRGLVCDLKLPHEFMTHTCRAIQVQVDAFRSLHAQDLTTALGGTEECVHLIELEVHTGTRIIRDKFLWDLNNPYASPEAHARGLCDDMKIAEEEPQAAVLVAVALREQLLDIARQVIVARESRSAKKTRRERGVVNEPRHAPAPSGGASALQFMRRPNNRISVRRSRSEWEAFEPRVTLITDATYATAAAPVAAAAATGEATVLLDGLTDPTEGGAVAVESSGVSRRDGIRELPHRYR